MINNLACILLLFSAPLFAQGQRQVFTGRVVALQYALQDVLVVNLQAEREVLTDSLGMFRLQAKAGDTLVITNEWIQTESIIVDDDDFNALQIIQVDIKLVHQLDEVVIEKDIALTSEGLGLVPKGQKQYTQAERKLYTAGDFKPIHLLGILAGGMQLDPVFNAINGRTKMLKKAVEVERKEIALEGLEGMFTNAEITKEYNIPKENVNGFLFYCVEDNDFRAAVKAKNETLAKFLMSGLSVKYLEIVTEESENTGEE